MPQVQLQGDGVAGLSEALDSVGVPEKMGVDLLGETGSFCRILDELPGPLTFDPEDPVVKIRFPIEGVAPGSVGQALRRCH